LTESIVKLCKRGHERNSDSVYPSNGGCKTCAAELQKLYREANSETRKAQQAEYRAINREIILERKAKRRDENGDVIRSQARAHYHANKEKIRARQAEYRRVNREAINAQKLERRNALRQAALDHYGHGCVCCGLDISDTFLSIDHISGNGAEHRREIGAGEVFYTWLRNNAYPDTFQTLCRSCNWAKRRRPACPHTEPIVPQTSKQKYHRKLKLEVLVAYGGSCACCGEAGIDFLHLDHINGDGKEHRRSLAGNPGSFYLKLREFGFPNDPPLRVLCDNCNYAVQFGRCPHG
jgi:hypothetical protein